MIDLTKIKLILGSQSPRRKELLEGLGLKFTTISLNIEEDFPASMPPEEVAAFLAEKKARTYQPRLKGGEWVLTADTVVIVEGIILNKPKNREEAIGMLAKLSGKMHFVTTGFCIGNQNQLITESDTAKVYFKELAKEEINHYVDVFSPFDKAGAYGIQEWIGYVGVERIDGSFYTVMGLPLHMVYHTLKQISEG